MTKTTSIILLCIVTALVLFLGVFSFIPEFNIGEYEVYHSPLSLIQKDGMFTDSVKASYTVELDEGVEFSSVQKILNARFKKAFGYYGIAISYDANSGTATITLPKTNNEAGSSADHILEHITQNGKVEILSVNYANGATYSAESVVLTQEHFKKHVRVQSYINGETTLYVCRVQLTAEGEELASKNLSSSTPYTCAVDGSVNTWVYYTGSELQITYAGSSESQESAKLMASFIKSGTLGATLTEEGAMEEISASNSWIVLAVIGAIVLASFIFFIVRYKTLGYVALINQLLAVVVFVIFAGLVHLEIFNIFAAIGVVLAYCFMTVFTAKVFDKITKNISEKSYSWLRHKAFADTNIVSLIAHGALLVLGIILWVIPTAVTAPLGNVLVYGAILSFIVTFCLNRLCTLIVAPLMEQAPAKSKARK